MGIEELRTYRDKLERDITGYQAALDAMKEGRQETFEVDRSTGEKTDLTPQRIDDFTNIVATLRSVIQDIDIKIGERRDAS